MTKGYWFKRRRYGYGWVPVTWQGWLVLLAVILVISVGGFVLLRDAPEDSFSPELVAFIVLVIVSVLTLSKVSTIKGPAPRWRMGKKSNDNPEEDW